MSTKIAWTDESWNPVTGCTPVSEGCKFCYAKRMTERFGGDFSKVMLRPDRLEIPLHWRKPRRVFVCSMGDLFHEDVPDEFIDRVFAVMALAERHTFQVLTKRPKRMHRYLAAGQFRDVLVVDTALEMQPSAELNASVPVWPLPNVWLMVSAENRKAADERIPLLLETPAAVRGVSLEPLLGPLGLEPWLSESIGLTALRPYYQGPGGTFQAPPTDVKPPLLDWVIVGGESGGPPERRLVERCDELHERGVHCRYCLQDSGWRPKPECRRWVQGIRDQCQAAGVAFFLKQWGPRAGQGTELDGREYKEMP